MSSAAEVPALYDSVVTHSRQTPLTHRFRYRTAYWLVDLDRLPQPSGPLGSSPASGLRTTSTSAPCYVTTAWLPTES